MQQQDVFMTQAEVIRLIDRQIATNLPYFISKFKIPTVMLGGRRAFYKADGLKLAERVRDFYEKQGGHTKERSATSISPQAQQMQAPRDQA